MMASFVFVCVYDDWGKLSHDLEKWAIKKKDILWDD